MMSTKTHLHLTKKKKLKSADYVCASNLNSLIIYILNFGLSIQERIYSINFISLVLKPHLHPLLNADIINVFDRGCV